MKFHFKLGLIWKVSCQAINALNFCKSTLYKSYKCTSYSNITTERTLHQIIITHITFYNYKKIIFKQFKHMTHDLVLITLNWLFKNLGRYSGRQPSREEAVTAGVARGWAGGTAEDVGRRWQARRRILLRRVWYASHCIRRESTCGYASTRQKKFGHVCPGNTDTMTWIDSCVC